MTTRERFGWRWRAPARRWIVVGAFVFVSAAPASALTIDRWTVDGGGMTYVQLGPFVVAGTIGQPDAGLLVGRDLAVSGGFWNAGGALPTGIENPPPPAPSALPRDARIYAAAPNPVITGTAIGFDLPDARAVDVRIFDMTGALMRVLATGAWPAGRHTLRWDTADSRGRRVAAGVYLVRVRMGALQRSQKLLVLR